jgi:hypothetical protein
VYSNVFTRNVDNVLNGLFSSVRRHTLCAFLRQDSAIRSFDRLPRSVNDQQQL